VNVSIKFEKTDEVVSPMTHLPATLCRGAGFDGIDAGLLLLAANKR
jgi:hypothetical protein